MPRHWQGTLPACGPSAPVRAWPLGARRAALEIGFVAIEPSLASLESLVRREFNYETGTTSRLPASCIEHRLEFGVTKPAIVSCVVSAVREWTQLYYHVNHSVVAMYY